MSAANSTPPPSEAAPPACPDCGAPISFTETREIGRAIQKEEVAMFYRDRPDEYRRLPLILGRIVGPWRREEKCSSCGYERAFDVLDNHAARAQ